jgi:Arc/MetJ family transcription regulator
MRATIELSDEVASAAARAATDAGQTLSELVDSILRRELCDGRAHLYEERRQQVERDIAASVERWRAGNAGS